MQHDIMQFLARDGELSIEFITDIADSVWVRQHVSDACCRGMLPAHQLVVQRIFLWDVDCCDGYVRRDEVLDGGADGQA